VTGISVIVGGETVWSVEEIVETARLLACTQLCGVRGQGAVDRSRMYGWLSLETEFSLKSCACITRYGF